MITCLVSYSATTRSAVAGASSAFQKLLPGLKQALGAVQKDPDTQPAYEPLRKEPDTQPAAAGLVDLARRFIGRAWERPAYPD